MPDNKEKQNFIQKVVNSGLVCGCSGGLWAGFHPGAGGLGVGVRRRLGAGVAREMSTGRPAIGSTPASPWFHVSRRSPPPSEHPHRAARDTADSVGTHRAPAEASRRAAEAAGESDGSLLIASGEPARGCVC